MNALLVVNPAAGRLRRTSPSRLAGLLEEYGLRIRTAVVSSPAQALAAAKESISDTSSRLQRLIVAGGDGTINSVLPALAGPSMSPGAASDIPLAILPLGSVNVLARELGLPFSLHAAASIAAQGVPRCIDLGRCNDRPFVLMAGFGLDGAVVNSVRSNLKGRLGALAYVFHVLRLLLVYSPRCFRIRCDDQDLQTRAWMVVVANASRYTYCWSLAPQARIDDGRLEVCILPDRGRLRRIRQAAAVLLRRPWQAPVEYLSGRRIEIQVSPPAAVQIDGEPAPETTSATIQAVPRGVKIMVGPAKEEHR